MGHVARQRDRSEVFEGIIAEIGLNKRIHGERPVRADQQRITVGLRVRDILGADAAAGPGAVLDHDRLPQRFADLIADNAADDVGIAARGERHDQPDRPSRIIRGEETLRHQHGRWRGGEAPKQ